MSVFPVQSTFVRGELSERLHARADLDLYRAGLSLCENFITLPHGGIRKRGGTYYVAPAPYQNRRSRVIPFTYSDDQAYCLVISHQIIRIFAYGAGTPIADVVTPWDEAHIGGISFGQSADVMWLAHDLYPEQKLTRHSHTSWSLEAQTIDDGPFGPIIADTTVSMYASAATGAITITALDGGGLPASVFAPTSIGQLVRIEMKSYTAIPPWEPNAIVDQPTVGAKRRYNGRVYETPTAYNAPTTHDARTGGTAPVHTEGTEWDGQSSTQAVPDASYVLKDTYIGLQWTYLHSGYGIARITGYSLPSQVSATVLQQFPAEVVGSGNASNIWRLGAFAYQAHPRAVAIFEERLMHARRFSTYGSKTGDFDTYETGSEDDAALSFQNAGGGKASDITWLEESDGFLLMGTIGGVRALSGAGIDEALTPSSFKNRRSSSTAPCAPIAPINTGRALVYVQKGRKALAELQLGQNLRYSSEDLGQVSEHIPKRGVVELAYQQYPDPFIWFPVDSGELGCFTYQPAQEVRGMHRHLLGGETERPWGVVESACVTPGQSGEDDVWLIVRRTILGTTVRYLEIMTKPFERDAIENAFQVDCGLSYSGAAVGTVTGLGHINSLTVDVLADSKVYRGLTVVSGSVTLPGGATAAKWHVGLPFLASADTLELDVGGRDGSLMGRRKRVNKVILSLLETDLTGLEIASKQKNRWEPAKIPSVIVSDGTVSLFTGNIEVPIDDSWEGMGQVRIRHSNPTPCTIRAMTPVFDSEP